MINNTTVFQKEKGSVSHLPSTKKNSDLLISAILTNNWEVYMGLLWNDVLTQLHIPKFGTIIEVAPGNENKIGNGLKNYGFEGKLYIIEPDAIALENIVGKYHKSLPKCTIIGLSCTLSDAIKKVSGENIDAVLSNHPLDDMILKNCLTDNDFSLVFQKKYGSVGGNTGKYWDALSGSSINQAIEITVHEWFDFMQICQPRFVGISQYESFYFKKHHILKPDASAFVALQKLKGIAKNYQQIALTSSLIQEKDRWYIAKNMSCL